VVRERGDRTADPCAVARVVRRPDLDPRQGQALRVHELEGAGVLRGRGDVVRHGQGDQPALALEAGEPEHAVGEQLQVVELTRGRAVLRDGRQVGHGPKDAARRGPGDEGHPCE
jgi:hypothetical protein